ncbi:MAG: hypothetical protein H6Q12_1092 [Bacteroidetes bacterium]|nr:hypothetical protein [Bacteroidota bacterium]
MITYIIIGITAVISFLCFNNQELFYKLAFNPYRTIKNKEWHRLITHGFVHADTNHLLINMFTFWSFGTYIEEGFDVLGFGTSGFLGLYFGGMIVASLYDLIKHKNDPYYNSVGASGAISAPLYLVYCQYMNKKGGGNINHNAHFYGAVYGLIYPLLLEPKLFYAFLSNF